jgi:hypothetical protein
MKSKLQWIIKREVDNVKDTYTRFLDDLATAEVDQWVSNLVRYFENQPLWGQIYEQFLDRFRLNTLETTDRSCRNSFIDAVHVVLTDDKYEGYVKEFFRTFSLTPEGHLYSEKAGYTIEKHTHVAWFFEHPEYLYLLNAYLPILESFLGNDTVISFHRGMRDQWDTLFMSINFKDRHIDNDDYKEFVTSFPHSLLRYNENLSLQVDKFRGIHGYLECYEI